MSNIKYLYADKLYLNQKTEINKNELIRLFPQYKEQWEKIIGKNDGWGRINLILAAWGDIGEKGGGSALVTAEIDSEYPIKTKETLQEQAVKYDSIIGGVHEFQTPRAQYDEDAKIPLAQMYLADPYADSKYSDQFILKYGTDEEKEIIKEINEEIERGEYYSLDMSVWKPVKMDRGEHKGENPIVTAQGNVAVGREYAGQSVRVFVRK